MPIETRQILHHDGAHLSYWLSRPEGAERSLIMLHGVASNHTRWSEFAAHTILAEKWNLLRPDLRGHGDSMFYGRISRSRWVTDLEAILEQEALPRVILLGHSLGAEIALDFAAAYPDRVAGLILIDPVFHQNLHGALAWVRRLQLVLWIPVGLLWLANALGLRRRRHPPRDMYALDEKTRATLRSTPGMKIADLYINPLADLSYIPLANYLQDVLAVVQPVPELKAIDLPVLALMSRGSSLSDRHRNEAQVRRIPNAAIRIVDCDHWPLTEQPEIVREIIDEWCEAKFEQTGPAP
ncbi:MAG: alpha/beta hydrolase [Thiotrichales bacterium]|nr:MAG: alpha/beta hydrolase [Thiotrichales bacterium]